jgi:hypothetical protein
LPTDCTKPDVSPNKAGYNGILGVGLFTEDCGSGCATIANNRIYFACSGTTCTPSTASVTQQVSNPVSFLPKNNNGVILQLPSVPESGAMTLSGYLVLGIGTQANNTPVKTHFLQTDNQARIGTSFNGKSMNAFIDSGSNGLFFPAPEGLTVCDASSGATGFYCPSSPTVLTAVQQGIRSEQVAVDFQIMSAKNALDPANPNMVFGNLGGGFPGEFDWGLPFFFGRTVYNGIEGRKSPLGTGPYWAY